MGLSPTIAAGLSPAQSYSVPSPAGLMTTFYCLRFETPPIWRTSSPCLYAQEQSDPVITPGTGFPFRRLSRLAGLRFWEELFSHFTSYDTGCIENYAYNISSIFACVFIAAVTLEVNSCFVAIRRCTYLYRHRLM
jgi:hypothetical protein